MAMKSGNKDAIVDGARQPGQASTTSSRPSSHPADAKQECANKHRRAPRPRRRWLAPRGRRLRRRAAPATRRRWTLAALPLQEGRRHLQRGRVREVRVPAHRQGGLADDLQDQVRDGGPALLPAGLGRVRPGVRRRRRGEPDRRPRRAEAAYAVGALLPEDLRPDAQGRLGHEGQRQPARRRQEGREGQERRAARSSSRRTSPTTQKGMITAFNRYVCYIKPAAGDKEAQEQLVEVKYARARTYFEAQHWEEAALALPRRRDQPRRQATSASTPRSSTSRASTCSASTSSRTAPACFDDMATDVPKFIELYCTGDKSTKNAEQCTHRSRRSSATSSASRRRSSSKRADKGGTDALELYEKGGNGVLRALAEVRRRRRCATNQPPQCEKLRRDRLQRGARLPGRRASSRRRSRARMILLNPQLRPGQDRAREEGDLRDRR